MAGKKKRTENHIIPFQRSGSEDDYREERFDDEDEGYLDDMSDEMAQQMMGALLSGMFSGGMTTEQYKGMLLDSLQPWKEVLRLAQEGDSLRVAQKAKEQIALINKKLRY